MQLGPINSAPSPLGLIASLRREESNVGIQSNIDYESLLLQEIDMDEQKEKQLESFSVIYKALKDLPEELQRRNLLAVAILLNVSLSK